MNYGYDPESKFLFSWDRDFYFEGVTDNPPAMATVVPSDKRRSYEIAGCKFLSGLSKISAVAWSDGESISYSVCWYDKDFGFGEMEKSQSVVELFAEKTTVALCGPVCRDPQKVAEFCRRFSFSVNYVCPVVDELAALGALVKGLRGVIPHRAFLGKPNMQEIDAEFVEFGKGIEADGYGRMAHLVASRVPVMNEMMTSVGISPFFGKMIHDASKGSDAYIVRSSEMDKFFPREPVSAKNYAAICVPVRMENTAEFTKATGCPRQFVDVFVTSEYVPGLPDFMRFYMVMSGRPFVGFADAGDILFTGAKVPVFRHNRGYKVPPDSMGKYDASRFLQG